MMVKTETRQMIDKKAKSYFFAVVTVVSLIMGIATTGTMVAGLASENMTWGMIVLLWFGIGMNVVILLGLNKKLVNKDWTNWIMMISLSILLLLMRLTTENAAETHTWIFCNCN